MKNIVSTLATKVKTQSTPNLLRMFVLMKSGSSSIIGGIGYKRRTGIYIGRSGQNIGQQCAKNPLLIFDLVLLPQCTIAQTGPRYHQDKTSEQVLERLGQNEGR